MERLTIDTKLLFCDISQCSETPGGSSCEDGYCDQRRVYERLRKYECLSTIADITALAKARDEGRLVVLPCKVGDKVWNIRGVILYFREPKEEVVSGFVTSDYGVIATFQSGSRSPIERFGNSIFFSRAEAEAGLVGLCALWKCGTERS